MYYDRSIEDKQAALDQELEQFQEEKNKEIEKWETYLDDVELIIADSLNIVQANATGIYDTLVDKADEYNLSLSEAITSPWADGALAVSDYQETFDTAMSSTMNQLDALKNKWQEVINKMAAAGNSNLAEINKENANYAAAMPNGSSASSNNSQSSSNTTTTPIAENTTSETTKTQPGLVSGLTRVVTHADADNGKGNAGVVCYPEDVKRVQQALKELGYYDGEINGITTEAYTEALKRFQKAMGVYVDARVGPETRAAFKAVGYKVGTTSLDKSGIINIDELGEELVLRAKNGRLTYMEKGSGIVPADLTTNLMKWGELDPSDMLDQNRPSISAPYITNNETIINIEYGDILHIDNFSGDKPADLSKMIDQAFNKHMKQLNAEIRKYTRG